MKFSQRLGLSQIQKLVQKESMDEELKNSLWNGLTLLYWDKIQYQYFDNVRNSSLNELIVVLWTDFFKRPTDTIPALFSKTLTILREWYFSADWHDVYDFVEFVAQYGLERSTNKEFIEIINIYLERENSAYRFVSGELTEIISQVEIESVESALSSPYQNVRTHLKTALHLMNDKEHPDFRNSIKESISAVEAAAKHLVQDDKATLGQALSIIEKNGNLHKALKSAFASLYGYTSDADGIRHALLEESSLKKSDARFMLVSCSSFVNYLLELSEPIGE